MVDLELAKELELDGCYKQLDNIENQYHNLIYNELLGVIQERWEYDKTKSLIEWKCAICGADMFADKNRDDIENFVCESCRDVYNNDNEIVDKRILKSRTKMYKFIENRLYEELEDKLKGGSV